MRQRNSLNTSNAKSTGFPVLFECVRRGSNSQPSVPKFEAERFRNSRRNHQIDRESLPVNDFGEHIQFRRIRQFRRRRVGKRYRFEDSSNPLANPNPSDPLPSDAIRSPSEGLISDSLGHVVHPALDARRCLAVHETRQRASRCWRSIRVS